MQMIDKKDLLFLFATFILLASCSNKIWQLQSNEAMVNKIADCKADNKILKYVIWKTNFVKLTKSLENASSLNDKFGKPIIIDIPTTDNTLMAFKIYVAETMNPELAKQFPELKSYMGNAVADNSIKIRIDTNPKGFHALITSSYEQWLVEPICAEKSKDYYFSFLKGDVKSTREPFNEKR